eukprot:CAMPEP_0185416786 /NCGR_PEP_ID=MMETSP1365-20130426/7503_1 /TAXON_ID=38817 /ORGANISM="Gephyrocapsa oceanica, Strain RCC1303" /LENGTH=45 /DNA_ID= /DNA_START= /DNA_END= /DNA_ORIENTATION=
MNDGDSDAMDKDAETSRAHAFGLAVHSPPPPRSARASPTPLGRGE